jgi:photosystem II PsbZ protein
VSIFGSLLLLENFKISKFKSIPSKTFAVLGEPKMTIIFQFVLTALVLFSFLMVIGVPVAYASPQNWTQAKPLIFLGSGIWVVLVVLVAILNFFVA